MVSPTHMIYRTRPNIHQNRVLPRLAICVAVVVFSIPNIGVHRRVGERVSGIFRSCDPASGDNELGFWKALSATRYVRHHGSSSFQVGRCRAPSSLLLSALTGLR